MIGRYLLPPDTKKGYSHHRGIISVPSSEIDNPHKLASPYEFFIVVQKPGAYHLDGDYTAFGRVIKGMDIVDKINKEEIDKRAMDRRRRSHRVAEAQRPAPRFPKCWRPATGSRCRPRTGGTGCWSRCTGWSRRAGLRSGRFRPHTPRAMCHTWWGFVFVFVWSKPSPLQMVRFRSG